MNGSSENRKEATDRKMEVLSAKTKTRIGSWNVRTMHQTSKLAQITAENRRYKLYILGAYWIGKTDDDNWRNSALSSQDKILNASLAGQFNLTIEGAI